MQCQLDLVVQGGQYKNCIMKDASLNYGNTLTNASCERRGAL